MFEEFRKKKKNQVARFQQQAKQHSPRSLRTSHLVPSHPIQAVCVESLVTTTAQIISSNTAVTSKGTSAILGPPPLKVYHTVHHCGVSTQYGHNISGASILVGREAADGPQAKAKDLP